MKALELLRRAKKYNSNITDKEINEAIAELEALQHPKSCDGCKYETQGRYRVPCDVCARTLHDEYTSKEQ